MRLIAGLVWFGTVLRRLGPNQGEFEERITTMGEGTTLLPPDIMELAIQHWFIIYSIVITIEIVSSFSLLTGTLARGGAFLATLNGFAIGMAGIGLGIVDLIIPWSVALITLFLLLFTHPGRYRGLDASLVNRNLPGKIQILT